jgi:hypothetical protein
VAFLRERRIDKRERPFHKSEGGIRPKKAELERVLQKLEGQRAKNAYRITGWIQMLDELYHQAGHTARDQATRPVAVAAALNFLMGMGGSWHYMSRVNDGK